MTKSTNPTPSKQINSIAIRPAGSISRLVRKQHAMLIEVLIAFTLVALCAIPLISPQVFFLKENKKSIYTIQLDHTVSLLYAEIIERMHKNEIPFEKIIENTEHHNPFEMIDQETFEKFNLCHNFPFKGSFRFEKNKSKGTNDKRTTIYLFDLIFTFLPSTAEEHGFDPQKKLNMIEYRYVVFAAHDQTATSNSSGTGPNS